MIWLLLLLLTVTFGVATIALAGMPDEMVFNDGSVGYVTNSKESICNIAFAVFFFAWLMLGVRIKKESKTTVIVRDVSDSSKKDAVEDL